MKKVLLIVLGLLAGSLFFEAIVIALAWHPLMRMASRVLVASGDQMVRTQNYVGAIGCYNQALALDPRDVLAYVGRGYAQTYRGQFDAAVLDADAAVALDGQSAPAYAMRGWAREWKSDWDGAHADYDRAIQYDPTVANFYAHRGWVRFRQGENDGARKDLDEALTLRPQLAFAYHDRAWVRFMQDDLPGALEDEDSAIEFSAARVDYYLRRAGFRIRSDDPDGALADANAALNLAPHAPAALYQQGIALRRLGQTKDSVAAFDQLLQVSPHYSGALFERAITKYVGGDFAGALTDLKATRDIPRERPYTELWIWVVAVEQGAEPEADHELADYLTDARLIKAGTWGESLGDLLLGRTTPDLLAGTMKAKSAQERREHLCQLWFFAGKAALLHQDKAAARTDFQNAVATHAAGIVEFVEARRELARH